MITINVYYLVCCPYVSFAGVVVDRVPGPAAAIVAWSVNEIREEHPRSPKLYSWYQVAHEESLH